MIKIDSFVRILDYPENPSEEIDYSSYCGYVGSVAEIRYKDLDGYSRYDIAIICIPEKYILQHKPALGDAPLVQLEEITEEEFREQLESSKKKAKGVWNSLHTKTINE